MMKNYTVSFRFPFFSAAPFLLIWVLFFPAAIHAQAPVANFSVSATTVCLGSSVTFTDASTNSPASWSWVFEGGNPSVSASQNPVVTYTAAGTFSVSLTATNGGGSGTKDSLAVITVNPLPTPAVSVFPSATVCSGSNVSLIASGGVMYNWMPGGQTNDTNALANLTNTGSYTVTVTDLNGCSDTASVQVTVNPLPSATVTASPSPVICTGSNVSLIASGGVTYSWLPGGQTTDTNAIANLTLTSTYTLMATGANGCTGTAVLTVTVNPFPTASITAGPSSAVCSGSNVTLSASGGTTYKWLPGGQTVSALMLANVTAAASYTLVAANPPGCTDTASMVLAVNPLPTPSISASPSFTICKGSSAVLTASGAAAYLWTSGQTSSSITVSPSVNTTYTVTATDTNGCSAKVSRQVKLISPAISISATPSSTICRGSGATLTASGGATYSWSTGQTGAALAVMPTVNSTYTVIGTDTNGCSRSASKSMAVSSPSVTISISPAATICSGSSATITASGGSSFSWWTGPTTAKIVVSPTALTSYTVTGTNSIGCSTTDSVTLAVKSSPAVSVSASSDTVCSGSPITLTASGAAAYVWFNGQTTTSITQNPTITTGYSVTGTANGCSVTSVHTVTVDALTIGIGVTDESCAGHDGTATATVSGIPPYLYSWNTGASTQMIIGLAGGTYSCTVTDSLGCVKSKSGFVNNSCGIPVVMFSASSTTICAGDSVRFTDASSNTPTSWSWSFGGGSPSSSALQNPVITYTAAGTYSVSLTAANSNGSDSLSQVAYITVNPVPSVSVSVSPSSSICAGAGVTLSAAGANAYSWLPGGQTGSSRAVVPSSTTTYTLTGTTAGCSAAITQQVVVNPLPTPSVTVSPQSTICPGSSAVLSASGGVAYLWSLGQTGSGITVNPTANTSYSVTVTDTNGCSAKAVQAISIAIPAASISVSPASTVCIGSSATLTGGGGATYSWMPGGDTTASITVSPTANTTYTVTATSALGCSKKASRLITVSSPSISIGAAPSSTLCSGTVVTLSATGGVSYNWMPGGQATSGISDTVWTTFTYSVVGTNALGCTALFTKTIAVNPSPTVAITVSPSATLCSGNTILMSASGAPSYSWLPGGKTTSVISVKPTASITYTLIASNGCSVKDTQALYVHALPPVLVLASPSDTVCKGASTVLAASGGASYLWGGGQTNSVIAVSPSASTSYTVTATDTNGCSKTFVKSITVDIPNVGVSVTPSGTICAGAAATLTGSGALTYSWSPGGLTGSSVIVNPTSNTNYVVTGADARGCTNANSKLIKVSTLTITASPSSSVCAGNTIKLTASGGSGYVWLPGGQTTSVITDTASATSTYTVIGITPMGCNVSVEKTIYVSPCTGIASVADGAPSIRIFPNPSDGLFTLQMENGNNGMSYVEMHNLMGEKVYSEKISNLSSVTMRPDIPAGVYFLRIVTQDNREAAAKIVIR